MPPCITPWQRLSSPPPRPACGRARVPGRSTKLFTCICYLCFALALGWCLPAQAQTCDTAYQDKAYQAVLTQCYQAASKGDLEAAFRLGEAYEYGNSEVRDVQQALRWYEQAAERGHALAQRNLATLYSNGTYSTDASHSSGESDAKSQGIRQDPFKAYQWYKRAAAQGQPHSQLMLGMMYLYGEGAIADSQQALYWIQSAAENNEPYAQYMYGKMLFPKDADAGIRWYRKAAAQNNEYALYRLGVLYYHGQHLVQDYEMALDLAERAIAAGHRNGSILKRKVLEMRPDLARATEADTSSIEVENEGKPRPSTIAQPRSAPTPQPLTSQASPGAPAPALLTKGKGANWLFAQPPQHYSIQLAVMKELTSIQRFHRWYGLENQTHYYQSGSQAGDLYVLLHGSYPSQETAQAAIKALPEKVQQLKPWVRSLGTLQQSYQAVSAEPAN